MRSWSSVRRVFPFVVVAAVASAAIVAAPDQNSAAARDVVTQPRAPEPAKLTETPLPTKPTASPTPQESAAPGAEAREAAPVTRLTKSTEVFSLLGVTWDDADDVESPQVEVRWRSLDDGWSDWTELEAAPESVATAGSRPGTDPLWVGKSDGVDVRVSARSTSQPTGLRVLTVTEGKNGDVAPVAAAVGQPKIISRSAWGASGGSSCSAPVYGSSMLGTTLHHTAGSNSYTKAQSAGILRSTQAYHTKGQGWCDIGYNFLVDKYGQIFEGRKGGITKMVRGAHAGVNAANERTVGVSMMGNYDVAQVPSAMKSAVADLIAWRHSLAGLPAKGTYSLGGKKVNRIMGHRDVKSTACPGRYGYAWLTQSGGLRDMVASRIAKGGSSPKLDTPTNLRSTGSTATSLDLSWDAVADAPGYRIQLSKKSSMADAAYYRFSTNKGTISSLDPGTTYWFRVVVIDPKSGDKLSDYTATPAPSASTAKASSTGYPLATPKNLKVSGSTSTSLSLRWEASTGAKGYRVQLSRNQDMSDATYHRFTGTSGTIKDLAPGTTYWVRVTAIDPVSGDKTSDYTSTPYPSGATTGENGYPLAIPKGLEVTGQTSSSLELRWKASERAKGYRVQLSKNASMSGATYHRFTGTTGTITKLSASTTYYLRVAAIDPTSGAKTSDYTAKPYISSRTGAASSGTTARNTVAVPSSKSVTFSGHGYGHGIGMSQYGAQGQARDGRSWTQILSSYYPGTDRSTKSGDIRVHITADTTDSVMVEAKSGITFRQGSKTVKLPTSVGGKKVVRWSIDTLGSDRRKSTLRYRTGSTWQTFEKRTWTGEAQLEASTLELVMPSGPNRVYRTALRSALPKSGATNRDTVNVLSVENYTRGVVAREMPASWHSEALKAQSVAARTYGVRGLNAKRHYDMCDTTSCQVYGGVAAETATTDAAVSATKGTVLTYKGALALTQFSSSSGGFTNVGSQPYLKAVDDPWDGWSGNKNHAWKQSVSASTIQKKYPTVGTLKSLQVTKRNGHGSMGGRVSSLKIVGSKGTKTISGVDARWAFGLKSDWFGF